MTSAEATGSGYYYGHRQVDDSPGGFGYHGSQPIPLQPVTDRTYRDVTNRYSDVGWHHHRNGPQRQAAPADVFVQQQQRGDMAKFSGDWTPIVLGHRSPDDQGRPFRNHYGYHERATGADVERRPLKDDRPETVVASGLQTTVRSVDANELLQVWMGEHSYCGRFGFFYNAIAANSYGVEQALEDFPYFIVKTTGSWAVFNTRHRKFINDYGFSRPSPEIRR